MSEVIKEVCEARDDNALLGSEELPLSDDSFYSKTEFAEGPKPKTSERTCGCVSERCCPCFGRVGNMIVVCESKDKKGPCVLHLHNRITFLV